MKKILFILLALITVMSYGQKPDSVNIGSAPDARDGDNLRGAMIKLNNYDDYLYEKIDSLKFSLVDYTECAYNSTTNIDILPTNYVSFILHYVAERNTGSAIEKRFGQIIVGYDDTSGNTWESTSKIAIDLGFTIESDISGGNIRLNIIVDNSTTNNLYFHYNFISKIYE